MIKERSLWPCNGKQIDTHLLAANVLTSLPAFGCQGLRTTLLCVVIQDCKMEVLQKDLHCITQNYVRVNLPRLW